MSYTTCPEQRNGKLIGIHNILATRQLSFSKSFEFNINNCNALSTYLFKVIFFLCQHFYFVFTSYIICLVFFFKHIVVSIGFCLFLSNRYIFSVNIFLYSNSFIVVQPFFLRFLSCGQLEKLRIAVPCVRGDSDRSYNRLHRNFIHCPTQKHFFFFKQTYPRNVFNFKTFVYLYKYLSSMLFNIFIFTDRITFYFKSVEFRCLKFNKRTYEMYITFRRRSYFCLLTTNVSWSYLS